MHLYSYRREDVGNEAKMSRVASGTNYPTVMVPLKPNKKTTVNRPIALQLGTMYTQ
jgi:hypothetical protein